MEMEKKNIAIIILAIALVASGVGNIFLATALNPPPEREQILVFGTAAGIPDLDPHYAYDSASIDVINQVCEGLMKTDLTDPNFGPVPSLAVDFPVVSSNNLEYTFTLRDNVTFHDGTKFNATAVKWNFDRLNHFLNYSSNDWLPAPFNEPLPADVPATQFGGLIQTADGRPLINETQVVSEYVVKLILNEPKGPFLAILAYAGLYFMSPAYTPPNEYLEAAYSRLIGTGPFIYESFTPDVDIRFRANDEYWRGAPTLRQMVWLEIEDTNTRNQALLSKEVDILTGPEDSFLDQFDADPDITLYRGAATTNTEYVMLDCIYMNVTMRKAASYAFDYDYVITEIMNDQAVRLTGPIAAAVPFANTSKDYPVYDLEYARQILKDAGVVPAAAPINDDPADSYWQGLTIANWNYTWNVETDDRGRIANKFKADMAAIGIKVEVFGESWGEVIVKQIVHQEQLMAYSMGWLQDYNDPENYITPFFSNISLLNGMRYYEPDVEALLRQGATEPDQAVRAVIYDQIQTLMIERDYPALWLVSGKNNDAWLDSLKGWVPNQIGFLNFYTCYF
ncbi:MAG: ABC transporter substrate-binding protein [Promethearchaeota archaeon]